MSTIAEKKAALAPIDFSSIVFDDEEDEKGFSSSVYLASPMSSSISPTHVTTPMTSSSPSGSSSAISSDNHPTKIHKVLEPADRSADFFWPNYIRPLELQGSFYNIRHPFDPNNNDIDEILNGPRGEMTPITKPPYKSPKWNWEPKITLMRDVWTMEDNLESADCGIDVSGPMNIRPVELYEDFHLPPTTPYSNNNELMKEPKGEMLPVACLPVTCSERDLELGLKVVKQVGTEKE